jgi:hypothetical protein
LDGFYSTFTNQCPGFTPALQADVPLGSSQMAAPSFRHPTSLNQMTSRIAAAFFCLVFSVWSQTLTGGITGTVKDNSGAVIPGALVTLTFGDAAKQTVKADAAGRIRFPAASARNVYGFGRLASWTPFRKPDKPSLRAIPAGGQAFWS